MLLERRWSDISSILWRARWAMFLGRIILLAINLARPFSKAPPRRAPRVNPPLRCPGFGFKSLSFIEFLITEFYVKHQSSAIASIDSTAPVLYDSSEARTSATLYKKIIFEFKTRTYYWCVETKHTKGWWGEVEFRLIVLLARRGDVFSISWHSYIFYTSLIKIWSSLCFDWL